MWGLGDGSGDSNLSLLDRSQHAGRLEAAWSIKSFSNACIHSLTYHDCTVSDCLAPEGFALLLCLPSRWPCVRFPLGAIWFHHQPFISVITTQREKSHDVHPWHLWNSWRKWGWECANWHRKSLQIVLRKKTKKLCVLLRAQEFGNNFVQLPIFPGAEKVHTNHFHSQLNLSLQQKYEN